MEIEGDQPTQNLDDELAAKVARLAANGMGGYDWRGVEILAEAFGIQDVEMLIERLGVIKAYEPPNKD